VPVSYPLGAALVAASVPLVEELDHHPFITVGYDHLVVELWTHDKDGITQLDFTVAEFVDSFLAARS
jgi:4a-hydroxytetrahydrobiopterin dehydratase